MSQEGFTATDLNTTSELCDLIGITPQQLARKRSRGTLKLEPAATRKGRRRTDGYLWIKPHTLPKPAPVIGNPPDETDLPDGHYISVIKASGCRPKTKQAGAAPSATQIIRWIDEGCPLVTPNEDGTPRKLRGHSLEYRQPKTNSTHRRRFVHEADFNEAMSTKHGHSRQPRPGFVTTKRARRIPGVGYWTFKNLIENEDECRKLIGHPAMKDSRPVIGKGGRTTKRETLWWERDIHDAASAIKAEIAKCPGYLFEQEARRKHQSLPTTPLSYYKQSCQFLPNGRPIRWEPDVLRPGRDGGKPGSCHRLDVFHPEDVATIETAFKASGPPVIIRKDGRIAARRYTAPAAWRHRDCGRAAHDRVVLCPFRISQ